MSAKMRNLRREVRKQTREMRNQERSWEDLCDEVDTDTYLNEYVRAGGMREFEDWRKMPCCSCSPRHGGPEMIRPVGETERDRSKKCLDQLVRGWRQ